MSDMPTNNQSLKKQQQIASANDKEQEPDAPVPAKTIVKNAHATGNGTTGEHDGEHNAFEDDSANNPPLDGAEQY